MKKILVVESNTPMRRLLVQMLRRAGHTVTPVPSGVAAIFQLRQQTYDVILTANKMTEMSGRELILLVRAADHDIGIIWFSMLAEEEAFQRDAKTLRVNATLKKPCSEAELIAAVEQASSKA